MEARHKDRTTETVRKIERERQSPRARANERSRESESERLCRRLLRLGLRGMWPRILLRLPRCAWALCKKSGDIVTYQCARCHVAQRERGHVPRIGGGHLTVEFDVGLEMESAHRRPSHVMA